MDVADGRSPRWDVADGQSLRWTEPMGKALVLMSILYDDPTSLPPLRKLMASASTRLLLTVSRLCLIAYVTF